ncbi:hypothetical protein LINGRAHAP2_LOCUS20966 [Linum grandiflorum]
MSKARTGFGFIEKLCYAIDILLSIDPPPFRLILVIAALCFFVLPAPAWRYFSCVPTVDRNSGHSSAVNGGWLLPATPLTLVLLLRWFSSTTSSNWTARPRRTLMPYWIASEGMSPWVVTLMILQLVVMVRYRPSFPDHSLPML